MKVIWSREAARAIYDTKKRIDEHDPAAALRQVDRLIDAGVRLSRFPHIGRVGRLAGTRELVVAGTPFILVYRVGPDAVEITHVRHHAQARD